MCVTAALFIYYLFICFLEKMGEGRRERMEGQSYLEVSGYKIKPLWKTSCWGRGMSFALCHHVWLVWPFVDPSHVELPYCLFWFFNRLLVLSCLLLCACISVSHISSPPPLPLPWERLCFVGLSPLPRFGWANEQEQYC